MLRRAMDIHDNRNRITLFGFLHKPTAFNWKQYRIRAQALPAGFYLAAITGQHESAQQASL